jgi:hypothetical protein
MLAVAEAGDSDIGAMLAVGHRPGLGERERPACIDVLVRRPGGRVGPYLASTLACFDRILLRR